MNTIKQFTSYSLLFVLILITMASCSVNYGYRRPYHRPHYGYGRPVLPPPARPGWYGRW